MAKLASKLIIYKSEFTAEISGDQEKWNECLDPDAMRLMSTTFLLRIKAPQWVVELFNFPLLVFKGKVADLGERVVYKKGKSIKRVPFHESTSEFDKYKPLIIREGGKSTNDISCRLGMFMGMYNFTSTLIALIAADCKRITGNHVDSSDDFSHFVYTNTQEEFFQEAETLRRLFKMVGVNMSSAKTIMISPMGIGEYNSKYHFLDFVGNVATELPALVPVGSKS